MNYPNECDVKEFFFCRWKSGAAEYFDTLEEALEKAKQMYVRGKNMSDESHEYWLKQKSVIGKEIRIIQHLDTIDVHHPISK